jgi:hypothetical protein
VSKRSVVAELSSAHWNAAVQRNVNYRVLWLATTGLSVFRVFKTELVQFRCGGLARASAPDSGLYRCATRGVRSRARGGLGRQIAIR